MKKIDFVGWIGLFLAVFSAFIPDLKNFNVPFWIVLVSFSLLILVGNYLIQKNFGSLEADKNLFLEVVNLLPRDWGNVMNSLKTHDFHYPFSRHEFDPIMRFAEDYSSRPGFFFHDSVLEKKRQELCKGFEIFVRALCSNTFPSTQSQEDQEIPTVDEMVQSGTITRENAEKIRDERVKVMNDSSAEAYKCYEVFVNTGIKRLKTNISLTTEPNKQ